nr:hypothetical protein [Tanacetum cinerariifolium]
MRIKESPNVTFDESLPEPKLPSLVEDDRINEPIVQDLNGPPSLQVNISDEGYPESLKEARGHLIEQVIGHFLSYALLKTLYGTKISHKLKEPLRNTHVDECVCSLVYMMEENVHDIHKEMREIYASINNDLKVLTAVIEDIVKVPFFKIKMKNELKETTNLAIVSLEEVKPCKNKYSIGFLYFLV